MSNFKFNVRAGEVSGCLICEVIGTLDITTAMEFEITTHKTIKQGNERLIFDFSQLDYINSQGLGALLSLHKVLDSGGGGLVIVSVAERCQRIFDITGLDKAISVYKDIAEALRKDPLFKVR
jgi:anti-anti-sigma factor